MLVTLCALSASSLPAVKLQLESSILCLLHGRGLLACSALQSLHILHWSRVDAADNLDVFECSLAAPNSTEYEEQ